MEDDKKEYTKDERMLALVSAYAAGIVPETIQQFHQTINIFIMIKQAYI